ncbi:MAG: hypothetical protein QOF61_722, partial [Acidobacteriota bacterium]|nr:hypothetical protein [Acidobacteriota bacterium]
MTSTSLRTLTLSVAASVALFNPAAGCLAQSQPTKRAVVTQPAKDESLRRELLKMLDDDQAVRQRLIDAKMQGEALAREQQTLDAANTKRLQEIFKTRGFPGAALVGKDGVGAVVVMLLHSPSLELQRMALPHVERAARRGEVPPDSFALLTDDVLNAEGKPQLYGTNFDIKDGKLALAKTQDPARLDARRRKLHQIPIREYAKFLAEMY